MLPVHYKQRAQRSPYCEDRMPLTLTPDMGVPLEPQGPLPDLIAAVDAAANTTLLLTGYGLEFEETASDDDRAADLLHSYAEDPVKASEQANKTLAKHTPASVRQVKLLLDEFSHPVVQTAVQIRNLVINKLLIESDNPDPRIRIKSIELLGKISDVSLFSEKSEVTITHQTTDDIRDKLRAKLARLANPRAFSDEDVIDVTPEPAADGD